MPFLDLFKNTQANSQSLNELHLELKTTFPNKDDDILGEIACISGLMAKVAHVDFEVSQEEKESICKYLADYGHFNLDESKKITHLALTRMEKLKGMHTGDYCSPLSTLLSKSERFDVLKLLFKIAASDDSVDNNEVEVIRTICKSLLLEHKHFVSAKAHVGKHLASLKGSS